MTALRRLLFWVHLTLGLATGGAGALMAGTAVIMAFADTYLDAREFSKRNVAPPAKATPRSLDELALLVQAAHGGLPITRVGLDRNPRRAFEFYYGTNQLSYTDPYSGEIRSSDSVPLRRTLHKGVEQWHRFLGLSGDRRDTGKRIISWSNLALVPLLLTGLILWRPAKFRLAALRGNLIPAGPSRGRGTQRGWHTALGFWALPFLLIMVLTGVQHSFPWARDGAARLAGHAQPQPGSSDSLWAPGLPPQSVPENSAVLSLDELRTIAERELPGWRRLDIFPAPLPKSGRINSARISALGAGRGPSFFPTTLQLHPYTGEILDTHSWDDLGGASRLIAWGRWLHKGEAFGRTGQIVAGLACLAMLVLIYTGWALALRRMMRRNRIPGPQAAAS